MKKNEGPGGHRKAKGTTPLPPPPVSPSSEIPGMSVVTPRWDVVNADVVNKCAFQQLAFYPH